jgi:hypothetical protein
MSGAVKARLTALPRRGVRVLRKALPVPGQSAVEDFERNRFNVDQIPGCDFTLPRRQGTRPTLVAHPDRGHAIPRRRYNCGVPADLGVIMCMRIDKAGCTIRSDASICTQAADLYSLARELVASGAVTLWPIFRFTQATAGIAAAAARKCFDQMDASVGVSLGSCGVIILRRRT